MRWKSERKSYFFIQLLQTSNLFITISSFVRRWRDSMLFKEETQGPFLLTVVTSPIQVSHLSGPCSLVPRALDVRITHHWQVCTVSTWTLEALEIRVSIILHILEKSGTWNKDLYIALPCSVSLRWSQRGSFSINILKMNRDPVVLLPGTKMRMFPTLIPMCKLFLYKNKRL